eukprot:354879-Chlamydomonas_euryale.AAC.10
MKQHCTTFIVDFCRAPEGLPLSALQQGRPIKALVRQQRSVKAKTQTVKNCTFARCIVNRLSATERNRAEQNVSCSSLEPNSHSEA